MKKQYVVVLALIAAVLLPAAAQAQQTKVGFTPYFAWRHGNDVSDTSGIRVNLDSGVDLTPQNGFRGNLTIWVEEGRSECRRRGTAQSRSYGSYGRLRWSWPEARRSRMPAAS